MIAAADHYAVVSRLECDTIRLKLVGGVWVGTGHVDADDLDRATAIVGVSPYSAELTDATDATLRVAGQTDHRRRRIRVRVEGFWHFTVAHEVLHSVLPFLDVADANHILRTANEQFPTLTAWQRRQGWTDDAEEKAAQLFACWRCGSADGCSPTDARTARLFDAIARGDFAEG